MKRSYIVYAIVFGSLSFVPYVHANQTTKYESLKEFCMAEKKDTPKNCECGQATADKILSSKEQAIALALMQGDRTVVSQLGENHDEFMNKLSKVTKGYTKKSHQIKEPEARPRGSLLFEKTSHL